MKLPISITIEEQIEICSDCSVEHNMHKVCNKCSYNHFKMEDK